MSQVDWMIGCLVNVGKQEEHLLCTMPEHSCLAVEPYIESVDVDRGPTGKVPSAELSAVGYDGTGLSNVGLCTSAANPEVFAQIQNTVISDSKSFPFVTHAKLHRTVREQ